jgi:hypothetical protein
VPLYPWLAIHRRDLRHPALEALTRAADELAAAERWREPPLRAWFAPGDGDLLAAGLADRP